MKLFNWKTFFFFFGFTILAHSIEKVDIRVQSEHSGPSEDNGQTEEVSSDSLGFGGDFEELHQTKHSFL